MTQTARVCPMRPLHGLLLLLAACAATPPERFKSERPGANTKEQGELIKRAMGLYWNGGEEYEDVIEQCGKDPEAAQTLAMLMVIKMSDTEQLQRRKQANKFQIRTLEQNIPYTRARGTIVKLGKNAMPIIEELVRHPHSDKRRRGVEILSRMPESVLPIVEKKFAACPAKYRRHYIEAVAQMEPVPASELMLLEWAKHEDYALRATALAGLASFGDRNLALLRDAVQKDPDQFVQRQVVRYLGHFRDRETAAVVVAFYARSAQRGDRHGIREAERTLVKMSKSAPTKRGRLIHYGLAHWQKWVLTLPVGGGDR